MRHPCAAYWRTRLQATLLSRPFGMTYAIGMTRFDPGLDAEPLYPLVSERSLT